MGADPHLSARQRQGHYLGLSALRLLQHRTLYLGRFGPKLFYLFIFDIHFLVNNKFNSILADAKEEMTEKGRVALLLEMITDSNNPSVRLHATRALAHLARGDGILSLSLRSLFISPRL